MKCYAIKISYGDGYTYSASDLEFFHTDKEYLQDLCDTFTILNEDKNVDFYVVEITVENKPFSVKDIDEFKQTWWLEGKI